MQKVRSNHSVDGLEIARSIITGNAKMAFDDIHAQFNDRLKAYRVTDELFFEQVSESAATLSQPLDAEKIQTTFKRDGKQVTEIVEIGERVGLFKNLVIREEEKLKEYWQQWEELQDDYLRLGIEVFGPESFGEDVNAPLEAGKAGVRWEMELLNLEHNARVEEMEEDIEDVAVKTLQKMKASEKVCD